MNPHSPEASEGIPFAILRSTRTPKSKICVVRESARWNRKSECGACARDVAGATEGSGPAYFHGGAEAKRPPKQPDPMRVDLSRWQNRGRPKNKNEKMICSF